MGVGAVVCRGSVRVCCRTEGRGVGGRVGRAGVGFVRVLGLCGCDLAWFVGLGSDLVWIGGWWVEVVGWFLRWCV